jgi:hypothetical protein
MQLDHDVIHGVATGERVRKIRLEPRIPLVERAALSHFLPGDLECGSQNVVATEAGQIGLLIPDLLIGKAE